MYGADKNNGWRIPAKTLEAAVRRAIEGIRCDQIRLMDLLVESHEGTHQFTTKAKELSRQLREGSPDECWTLLQWLIHRIELSHSVINLSLDRTALTKHLGCQNQSDKTPIDIAIPIRLQRRGVETKLFILGAKDTSDPDPSLCYLLAQSRLWFDQLASGKVTSVRELSKQTGVNESEITRALPLAFLAPKLVGDILEGKQCDNLTVTSVRRLPNLPMGWRDQATLLANIR